MPTLIALLQIAWWPGLPLLRGAALAPEWAGVAGVVALVTAMLLGWRHRRPALVALALEVLFSAGFWILPKEPHLLEPGDALMPAIVAMIVALFHVGAYHTRRTTALVIVGVLTFEAVETGVMEGFGGNVVVTPLLAAGVCSLAAALGYRRARRMREHTAAAGSHPRYWRRDRSATAEQVAQAWQAGSEAVSIERRRLVRELHDEAAHYLTSIVINASAAEVLGAERPDLRDQALKLATSTSRDAHTALNRLVDTLPFEGWPDAPTTDLATLVDDFRQLGQPVIADLPATAPQAAPAAAAYGIAREALTNILRYAPGGTVRLRFSYAGSEAELTVEDDGGDPDTSARTGLGSGRGVQGMRERAQILGGRLEAGPRPDGGWRVHAVLPFSGSTPTDAAVRAKLRWRLAVPTWSSVSRGVGRLLIPFAGPLVLSAALVSEFPPAAVTPTFLALLAHAAPLLLRRRHPWPAFAMVALTSWLGPLLIVTDLAPAESSGQFACLLMVELQAVYVLGSWGRPPALTWLGAVAAAVWSGAVLMVLVELDPAFTGEAGADQWTQQAMVGGVVALMAATLLFPPMFLIWLTGYAAWRRKRRRARDDGAIEAVRVRSAELARDERYRFAAGLRDVVLKHVAAIQSAAERDDLTAVVTSARRALAAMRVLLTRLGRDTAEPRAPALPAPGPASGDTLVTGTHPPAAARASPGS
ncbi:sensor histidine kinase [Paractinoplanes brasiliensis]|uniref:histidine kinase n=1 Tax=Paractinoplanes brasiliensis TaxID=52695 RepID=A0A4R6JL43_9ACTN|nr:sensor histidine kinase [Actinoplanes brasiliensis]TDO37014.1 signal transduction histidine kinase [Actinoplanes brasiliensis]GID30537.1 hypothetical protein Abr02nite_55200 [Actinoplanes brasiliensis]